MGLVEFGVHAHQSDHAPPLPPPCPPRLRHPPPPPGPPRLRTLRRLQRRRRLCAAHEQLVHELVHGGESPTRARPCVLAQHGTEQ